MKLEPRNIDAFKASMNFLTTIGSEVTFFFTENDVKGFITTGGTTLCVVTMPKTEFLQFEPSSEPLTIFMSEFNKIIKGMKKNLVMFMENDSLKVTSGTDAFSLPLIVDGSKEIQLPSIPYDFDVEVSLKDFTDALDKVSVVNEEEVRFDTTSTGFFASAKQGVRTGKTTILPGEFPPYHSSFSPDLLNCLKSKDNPKVKVEFGTEMPITISYTQNGISTLIIIANRVSDY